jgi:hypothetical protein
VTISLGISDCIAKYLVAFLACRSSFVPYPIFLVTGVCTTPEFFCTLLELQPANLGLAAINLLKSRDNETTAAVSALVVKLYRVQARMEITVKMKRLADIDRHTVSKNLACVLPYMT